MGWTPCAILHVKKLHATEWLMPLHDMQRQHLLLHCCSCSWTTNGALLSTFRGARCVLISAALSAVCAAVWAAAAAVN